MDESSSVMNHKRKARIRTILRQFAQLVDHLITEDGDNDINRTEYISILATWLIYL